MSMEDWKLRTLNEIAAELGLTPNVVKKAMCRLRKNGYDVPYRKSWPSAESQSSPSKAETARKQVDPKQCKSCRYRSHLGPCDYLCQVGRRRPPAVNGHCAVRIIEPKKPRRVGPWR